MPTAIVTGGSRGLGAALTWGLLESGWSVVIDARDGAALDDTADLLAKHARPGAELRAVAGDVTDPLHARELVAAAMQLGGLDLLVNNASTLGPSPLPPLTSFPLEALAEVIETNLIAPLGLVQAAAAALDQSNGPRVVNVTSDASVEAYEGWGGYGSSKAALDHLGAVLAAEKPRWKVWSVDPGDLRTQMHQDAFPGEDISDRPEPESVVPSFLRLIGSDRAPTRSTPTISTSPPSWRRPLRPRHAACAATASG
jgi:NAD(P)-dependent dehydrogenase (short-subunit alcohol dehydrogenase family)